MLTAACGDVPLIDPPPGMAPIAHVSVHNASDEEVLVRLAWPDGMIVIYEVGAGSWAMTTATIGVAGYPFPIEVRDPDCRLIGQVMGLGSQRMLVVVHPDHRLEIRPVQLLPEETEIASGVAACDHNWPPVTGNG